MMMLDDASSLRYSWIKSPDKYCKVPVSDVSPRCSMFHNARFVYDLYVASAGSNIKIVLLRLFFYFKSAYGVGVAHVIQEVGPEVRPTNHLRDENRVPVARFGKMQRICSAPDEIVHLGRCMKHGFTSLMNMT